MKLYKITQLLFLLFLTVISKGQVKTNLNNEITITSSGFFQKNYLEKINFQLPQQNFKELLELEDKFFNENPGIKFNKIATPIAVDLDIPSLIDWIDQDGISFGKFSIKLNGALSSSINFNKFYLPKGTEIYIYNEKGKILTGPITEEENNMKNVWGSWIYQGEYLNIEIKTPLVTKKTLSLHSRNIAYGYKDFYKTTKVGGFGLSGTCNINVVCPLGSGWEGERNSIAYGVDGNGTGTFSGALIMNTCNTNRPYILTADHNYKLALPTEDVSGWRFSFQVFSASCSTSQNSNGIVTYTGSTLRANWAPSDMCLVELDKTPATNLGIYYSGWNRGGTPALNGTALHHPKGDVMKISKTNALVFASYGTSANKHWKANWSPQINSDGILVTPVTEPGSSGSPIFDQNHRIVGQLHGGPSICGGPDLWDFYGRFDASFFGGGTSSTRLSDWLNPNYSGSLTTNTTSLANLIVQNNTLSLSISGDNAVCTTSSNYSIPTLPAGFAVQWTANPNGIVTVNTPNATQTTLTKIASGSFTLSAAVTNCQGTLSVSKILGSGIPTFRGWYNSKNNPQEPLNPWNKNSQFTNLVCYGSFITTITDITANASVVWQPSGIIPTGIQWYQIGNNLRFVLTDINQDAYFVVTITNACGTTNIRYKFTSTADNCPGANPLKAQISPNPASNLVSVSLMDNAEISKQKEITEIRLVDKMGNVKQKWNYEKGNATQTRKISVSSFPADVYMIMIFDGTNWISEKFIKQ